MPSKTRVRIFVDFWNFQLQWNNYHDPSGTRTDFVPIPWRDLLPAVLVAEALAGESTKFAGIQVYSSVDINNEKDRKLNSWLHHTLASFTGYSVEVKERKPRGVIRCQNETCKALITDCPHCKTKLRRTVEKGIDAAIITDLLSMAFDDNYDVAILVSGDADYAPAVRYIQKKTDKLVFQAFFKAHGDELRNSCWGHIFFDDLMPKLINATKPSSPSTG